MSGPLGKLKHYCDVCKKQCKDENGFKLHVQSGFHKKMQAQFEAMPERYVAQFSFDFEKQFTDLFRYKYGTGKFVPINRVYNEFIHDRSHTHLSSTRWKSLNGFAAYLGSGQARFDLEWEVQFPDTDGVEATQIMIIDSKVEQAEAKEEVKLSASEVERKREAKHLEK